jgi:chitosanase
MRRLFVLSFVLLAACSSAAADDASDGSEAASTATTEGGFTAEQHLRADRLVSVFENGTIDIQYDYVEDIEDGRGYTAGRGFTTATGDVLRVTKDYLRAAPSDPLARFVPELEKLAAAESGDTSKLVGFPLAWQNAAKTKAMRAAEDREVDNVSFLPAMAHADALGLKTILARAELYDAVVMHGDGDDPDGVPALLTAATKDAAGTPKTGVPEHVWLKSFLKVRRADVAHAYDADTRATWAEAVGRVDAFSDLLAAGNDDLHGPIQVGRGYDVTVP